LMSPLSVSLLRTAIRFIIVLKCQQGAIMAARSNKRTYLCDSRPDSCHEHCTVSRNVYRPFPFYSRSESPMPYYYVPRPPREHTCLLPMTCYTPQPPDVYYQPPAQEYFYQAPPQQYVYQPPAQVYEYQPPPQQYVYQPPPQVYEYQPPPQQYLYQPPPQRCAPEPGDARAFWELGLPGRSYGCPILV